MPDNGKRKIVLMFGPPGAGKGTQGAKLLDEFNLVHISTGDALREAVQSDSELGLKAAQYMDRGELVPDELIVPIVEEKLKKNHDKGFLFDGFPRTIPQAQMLAEALQRAGLKIDRVIYLNTGQEVILERLAGRRVCQSCGETYHVTNIPPKEEGVCDKCGGSLIQRDDDKEETILKRLSVYRKQTEAILKHYRDQGIMLEVDGSLPIAETYPIIRADLNG